MISLECLVVFMKISEGDWEVELVFPSQCLWHSYVYVFIAKGDFRK